MKPVFWSDAAIISIQNIYGYILKDSPKNAELVVDTFFDIGNKLNIFPEKIQKNRFIIPMLFAFSRNGILKLYIE